MNGPASVSSLPRRSDFDRVFKTGRRYKVGGIVVIVAPGLPDTVRLGLVAGRRIGGAVERNRVKRRLRHAIGETSPPSGIDVVVIGSREVASVPFERLVQWLRSPLDPGRESCDETGGTVR